MSGPISATFLQALKAGAVSLTQEIPHSHSWGMWVDVEILEYITIDDPTDEMVWDIGRLALLLKSTEDGTPGDLQFTEEEFKELLNGFRASCLMLLLTKLGNMEKLDEKSLFDDEGLWAATEQGREEATRQVRLLGLEDELEGSDVVDS